MLTAETILAECACQKTRMASRAITRAYDDALRPVGLRATQVAVLAAAAAMEAVSIASLATTLGMDRSTLTRALAPLEADGLVIISGEGWRRSRTVHTTEKGNALLEQALPLWSAAQAALRRQLGPTGWTKTIGMLDRLAAEPKLTRQGD